jgi:hypothetical protein
LDWRIADERFDTTPIPFVTAVARLALSEGVR